MVIPLTVKGSEDAHTEHTVVRKVYLKPRGIIELIRLLNENILSLHPNPLVKDSTSSLHSLTLSLSAQYMYFDKDSLVHDQHNIKDSVLPLF